MATVPNVYIIETLHPEDEGMGRMEGAFLSHVLRLYGRSPEYSYVRTASGFKDAIKQFRVSKCRYLHISAHGSKKGIVTTNRDRVSYVRLATLLDGVPSNTRLFMSSCEVVHDLSAEVLVGNEGVLSLLGPRNKILMTDAAAIWASFYHLAFKEMDAKEDNGGRPTMSNTHMKSCLKSIMKLFDGDFSFYTRGSNGELIDHLHDIGN